MSPELRKFVRLWGNNRNKPPEPPSAKKLQRLHDNMQDRSGAVDHNVATYVQAALDYGVELTRSEYRPLANRNWKTIQRFGVRLMRGLLLLAVILLVLGWKTLNTQNEIQDGRRNATIEKCHAGQHALAKLKQEIGQISDPTRRAEAEAQEKPTQELLETITGPIDPHDADCAVALKRVGL